MTHDVDDELDRLRLALLYERSRAERAEEELAALKAATTSDPSAAQVPAVSDGPAATSARRRWRRR